ncbi:MAG: Hsp20/alpha crystallin family protein [Thermodesulfobacteriota bacterium]|nr:Hsp20/alpha crystallin family protein [Thermodesulfobacteriota bacterium]
MEIIPRRPFGELSSMRREMDRFWNRIFGETSLSGTFSEDWSPRLDVSENKDNFIVEAELPGVDAKDVNVNISGNILTIKGEKKKQEEKKDEHSHYLERYYGSFQRSFQIPASVKTDKIEATFDKGVLQITLPKTEEAKKKEIEIKVK